MRLLKSPSQASRALAAEALLALAGEPARRPQLLQAGAAKGLLTRAGASGTDPALFDRPAAQALAKLLITAAAFIFGFDGDFDFKDIAKCVASQ